MKDVVKHVSSGRTLSELIQAQPALLERLGCADTLREIRQQPVTWRETGAALAQVRALFTSFGFQPHHLVLTGSGSSVYVAECLAPVLQARMGIPCRAIAAGTLMTDLDGTVPSGDGLLVSIARSGDSPESVAAVDRMLAERPAWRHLVVTCNAEGRLATRYRGDDRVHVHLLAPATNDRSLVMTSSFTNLTLAITGLLPEAKPGDAVARVAEILFARHGDTLAQWGGREHDAVLYLGDGAAHGAAHEAALKMLEMSAGAVRVMTETSLGLRHGPMAWLNRDSLLVVFLSGDANVRAYQGDLLRELSRKGLGRNRLVVGEKIADDWVGEAGAALDLDGFDTLAPVHQALVCVLVGQLLAFFQCLARGQHPDAPSQGVLTRVVGAFAMHTEGPQ